jgi:signal transduction histidine kinase
MLLDPVINFFLPDAIRTDKSHPRYTELREVVSAALIGLSLMLLFPPLVSLWDKPILGFVVNDLLVVSILLSVKFFGHYRIPMTTTAAVTYFIVYDWIRDSGYIYSTNVCILHMYLLAAVWVDKKYGWLLIFSNLGIFGLIYYQTLHAGLAGSIETTLGGPGYALVMNLLITVFFGGFLSYLQVDQERGRLKIRNLQDQRISMLDDVVKKRTEQLDNMRENIARDFHDETGNMLSAITRQASLLKLKLRADISAQPVVDSIIRNSNELYATSKDFLWHLNHDSDDPQELFGYLTAYGQLYYNQFDIAFSSEKDDCRRRRIAPSAALNLIYIFKEAMTNVVKHANAREVVLTMNCDLREVRYQLRDDGQWKSATPSAFHFGLANMERRCQRNGMALHIETAETGTRVAVTVPIHTSA